MSFQSGMTKRRIEHIPRASGCDPVDEAGPHPQPNNRYGLSKLLGEQLVGYEVRTNGLRAVSLRPFMGYDEDEEFGAHRSAMIRFAYGLATGQPIEVHRDGLELTPRFRCRRAIEAAASGNTR